MQSMPYASDTLKIFLCIAECSSTIAAESSNRIDAGDSIENGRSETRQ
jgi:hypothetical protein